MLTKPPQTSTTKARDYLLAFTAFAGMFLVVYATIGAIIRHGPVAAVFGLFLVLSLVHFGVKQ